MATRRVLNLYKGVTDGELRASATAVAARIGGSITWNATAVDDKEDFRTVVNDRAAAVYLAERGGSASLFCGEIAKNLDVVSIALRLQEDSLWDYSLLRIRVDQVVLRTDRRHLHGPLVREDV
jgi:hypothetical protein